MSKIAYVLLTNEHVGSSFNETPEGPVYTRESLKGTLQLLGCKPRLAEKVSAHAFRQIEALLFGAGKRKTRLLWRMHPRGQGAFWVSIPHGDFNKFMVHCLKNVYVQNKAIAEDWRIAASLREKRRSVSILLCGTSGTGKSTLASLLATRLGITTVISTDSVRNMMRSISPDKDNPLVLASSYDAGIALQQEQTANGLESPSLSSSRLVVRGYKAQSEIVLENLENLITESESRNESLVCEGVHLSLNFVIRLMRHHPTIIPFLVYIGNEQQHIERFSVRSKYMTLNSARNRYTNYINNIRCIQEFLIKKADAHLIPKVNNSNVDRSVAAIHQTTFACLRRVMKGESLYDPITNTTKIIYSEYKNLKDSLEWKAKGALDIIRSKTEMQNLSTPSKSAMISSDDLEESSEEDLNSSSGLFPCRVASSDTNEDLGSDLEDSSDGTVLEPHTEYGSLMETTDWDDHDD
eukprot:g2808.t1